MATSDIATPWEVSAECALVFGDAHQRVQWAEAVLERERDNFDRVVFLGDAFDSFWSPPAVYGFRATARWWTRLIERADATVLVGNHDLPYLESWGKAKAYKSKHPLLNPCSGFSTSKAREFAKEVAREHLQKLQVFTLLNGWLLSHAGFRENFWRPLRSTKENLSALWDECARALEMVEHFPSPLFSCGEARGGDECWGGPLWCDFSEFEDNLPLPQIFGHTTDWNRVRRAGRSYCIDGNQSCYALVRQSGEVELKSLDHGLRPIKVNFS